MAMDNGYGALGLPSNMRLSAMARPTCCSASQRVRNLEEENYYFRCHLERLEQHRHRTTGWRLSEPEKPVNKLNTLAKKMLDSDLRAFIKAGILDDNLEITGEGQEFLLAQYLADNKVRLAKEARAKIKEEKDK